MSLNISDMACKVMLPLHCTMCSSLGTRLPIHRSHSSHTLYLYFIEILLPINNNNKNKYPKIDALFSIYKRSLMLLTQRGVQIKAVEAFAGAADARHVAVLEHAEHLEPDLVGQCQPVHTIALSLLLLLLLLLLTARFSKRRLAY